ncbi:MAG: PAS sensor protein [Bacteroidales bacterium]|jgi:transcriptional regulator with PAS, ATPase and Fis domain|nr:PAS sensor protein [Bacteroidales bacterium]
MDDFNWAEELHCAITVCDCNANVVYQNAKSRKTFANRDMVGENLKECHSSESWKKILTMLKDGKSNTYTIEKEGIIKLIHQTPWFVNGKIMGLVEFSFEIPGQLPNYKR